MAGLVLALLACAVVIAVAGFELSRSADRLAQAHGWGRGWVGLAMLATVTSLPELASGLTAVLYVDAPNLAVGNALGACVFNLAFLVVVDGLQREPALYRGASGAHRVSAGFGIAMLGVAAAGLLLGDAVPAVRHVGAATPLLLALYLVALRSVFRHERALGAAEPVAEAVAKGAPPGLWLRFGVSALAVLAAGRWLPELADALAGGLGISRSAVGTVLMALVTTLPEMAVTLSAVRLGALDMAIGNLLGSNLFNVALLAIEDLAYRRAPLLGVAKTSHAATAATAMLMAGLVLAGLVNRPAGRLAGPFSWVSAGLAVVVATSAVLAWLRGA